MSKDKIERGHHRSTTLKGANGCPKWLDFYESDHPYPRDHFQAGVAAHAILEEIGLAVKNGATEDDYETVARQTCMALMRDGRLHVGNPEPPIQAEFVEAGYVLAMGWLERHECHPDDEVEIGMAFSATPANDGWTLCEFDDPNFRFRGILDRLRFYTEESEEYSGYICEVLDYKSSWVADSRELNTIQRWCQAIMVADWLVHKKIQVDCIRLAVGNLRDRNIYAQDLWLDEDDSLEKISRWRRFLSMKMTALDNMTSPRPANPGPACTMCPYKASCAEGKAFSLATTGTEGTDQTARAYAHADANNKRLKDVLQSYLTETKSTEVDGYEIGWLTTESQRPVKNAGIKALKVWLDGQPLTMDSIAAYLMIVKPNASQLSDLVYARYDDPERRELKYRELTEPFTRKRFGVRKKVGDNE